MSTCSNSDCVYTKSRLLLICKRCEKKTELCSLSCLVKHNNAIHQSNQDSIKINVVKTGLSHSKKLSSISDENNYFYYKNFNVIKKGTERLIIKKSDVYELVAVKSKFDNKLYAMKIVYKKKITNFKKLKSEILIHSKLQHDNIAKLFGYSENGDNIYIVVEYNEKGSLSNLLNKTSQVINENRLQSYSKCILNAVNYLYSRSVSHNNIVSSNFVIYENEVIKLWEFNYSEDNQHTNMSDIWASGLLTYELTQGKNLLDQVILRFYKINLFRF